MPWITLPGGITAHIKVAKARRRRCVGTEGGHPCPASATIQCDYPLGNGKTCDAYICRGHAKRVGDNLDHCPTHARQPAGLFTGLIP